MPPVYPQEDLKKIENQDGLNVSKENRFIYIEFTKCLDREENLNTKFKQ